MTSIKVRLYTYRADRKGTYPLVFQVIHDRKKCVMYSPYHIYMKCFDKRHNCVVNRRGYHIPYKDHINKYICHALGELQVIVNMEEELHREYTATDVVKLYKSGCNDGMVYIYMYKIISRFREEHRTGTLNAYRGTLNCIFRFMGGENLYFSDITVDWLNGFISFLREGGMKEKTIDFYCRVFRAVYNRAYKEEVTGTSFENSFKEMDLGNVIKEKCAENEVSIEH